MPSGLFCICISPFCLLTSAILPFLGSVHTGRADFMAPSTSAASVNPDIVVENGIIDLENLAPGNGEPPKLSTTLGNKNDDPEKAVPTTNPDELLVTFDDNDAANPKNWHSSRKWVVTGVLSATGFTRITVSTMMAPALGIISTEFDMNSVEANMALSVFLLATAFGPLVSESMNIC